MTGKNKKETPPLRLTTPYAAARAAVQHDIYVHVGAAVGADADLAVALRAVAATFEEQAVEAQQAQTHQAAAGAAAPDPHGPAPAVHEVVDLGRLGGGLGGEEELHEEGGGDGEVGTRPCGDVSCFLALLDG